MVDLHRLAAAYDKAQADLLAQRGGRDHWTGELSSSPLSTATAISALVLAEQQAHALGEEYLREELYQRDLSELVVEAVHWLAHQQNEDGGWGDTDKSLSNIATTMLVRAAFQLTGVPAKYQELLARADAYIAAQGGVEGLKRRFGDDKTFAVPILANCALAGLVPWRKVAALPFELAVLPQALYRFLNLPVVSYAIPALVAIGQARYYHKKPRNPLVRMLRAAAWEPSYRVLEQIQPDSGGYLEATPLTSFVVMSLASSGHADSLVVRRGVEFLLSSVRGDGSWPIDSNLATWNTTLALNALAQVHQTEEADDLPPRETACLDWVLSCQHKTTHPFTGAAPGGWAWTDLSGGVPDADDTPSALLALAARRDAAPPEQQARIDRAARAGVEWLLNLQNRDGGWPTFCRGWGRLPFDRSGADLTAHALRAIHAWRDRLPENLEPPFAAPETDAFESLGQILHLPARWLRAVRRFRSPKPNRPALTITKRIDAAVERGLKYLHTQQRPDGSWLPLWFGNQHLPGEENPTYGTAKVLLALRDLARMHTPPATRGLTWLARAQQTDGGWGGGPAARENGQPDQASSVEETSLAVEALLAGEARDSLQVPIQQGLAWLVEAVEQGRQSETAPIGFYFAKLWYHERLYPYIYPVSALGAALAHGRQTAATMPHQPAHSR